MKAPAFFFRWRLIVILHDFMTIELVMIFIKFSSMTRKNSSELGQNVSSNRIMKRPTRGSIRRRGQDWNGLGASQNSLAQKLSIKTGLRPLEEEACRSCLLISRVPALGSLGCVFGERARLPTFVSTAERFNIATFGTERDL